MLHCTMARLGSCMSRGSMYRQFSTEAAVYEDPPASRTPAVLFKTLFAVIALLLLLATGYAGWIVMKYWDQVGV
jgi:cytoskeletal protein RodZ